ncbi:hypothetical protein Q1695_012381 [Nippostrongylus brasiliensis]|nr:hypothetical protein Q1695_012381 [Nippostrongylus brasiliensis]
MDSLQAKSTSKVVLCLMFCGALASSLPYLITLCNFRKKVHKQEHTPHSEDTATAQKTPRSLRAIISDVHPQRKASPEKHEKEAKAGPGKRLEVMATQEANDEQPSREGKRARKPVCSKPKTVDETQSSLASKTKSERKKREMRLFSVALSAQLPRAPKGHHDDELDQMERILDEESKMVR